MLVASEIIKEINGLFKYIDNSTYLKNSDYLKSISFTNIYRYFAEQIFAEKCFDKAGNFICPSFLLESEVFIFKHHPLFIQDKDGNMFFNGFLLGRKVINKND